MFTDNVRIIDRQDHRQRDDVQRETRGIKHGTIEGIRLVGDRGDLDHVDDEHHEDEQQHEEHRPEYAATLSLDDSGEGHENEQ